MSTSSGYNAPMHIHLDLVGGLAGDMFAAALLDAYPEHEEALRRAFANARLDRIAGIGRRAHRDHALTGSRFEVDAEREAHAHRSYRDVRTLIQSSALPGGVVARALDIFARLAEAESRVHGVAVEDVAFHEVGAWDSIADIVAAAWLIEALDATSWSSGPVPLGSGRVKTAHGSLPVPAPATALLLEGCPVFHDGVEGERVTPTGAAILSHLRPSFSGVGVPARLHRNGVGFGTKVFDGISNIVRVLCFEPEPGVAFERERIAVCEFEVDDQTPEDLALGLERLRTHAGVLDVVQAPVFGKKGRFAAHVRVLARLEQIEPVLTQCFFETRTLGIRWQVAERALLAREAKAYDVSGHAVRVKHATRPGGVLTAKAEADDVAEEGGFAARDLLRRRAESAALASKMSGDDDV